MQEYIDRVSRYDPESADVPLDPGGAGAVDGRNGGWVDFAEQIDDRLAMGETMMLGLRLVREGVAFARFQQRHGRPISDVFAAEMDRLELLAFVSDCPTGCG